MVTWGKGQELGIYPKAEPQRRNKKSSYLFTYKLKVYCPQVQLSEQILFNKVHINHSNYTYCAACDYPTPLALQGGFYCDAHPAKNVLTSHPSL